MNAPIQTLTAGRLEVTADARQNNFDFLRVTLASLVIFSHSYQLGTGNMAADPLARLMRGQMSAGAVAVDFFFALSGFLVTKSWQQSRTAGDFVRKRLLRIYPGFAVALIFCVFVIGPLGGAEWHTYFTTARTYKYFQMLLLRPETHLPGVFVNLPNSGEVNASLWTIRFELLCYIGVLLVGLSGLIRGRAWMLGAMAICSIGWAGLPGANWNVPLWGSMSELPRLATFFLSGAVFYLYREVIPHSRGLLIFSLAALAITCWGGLPWTLPVAGSYALFYTAFSRTLRLRDFGRFGDFSFGLYLYAYPIQQLLVQRLGTSTNPLALLAMSLIITLALAVISWHGVERPFLRLKPRPVISAAGSDEGLAAKALCTSVS
jgi:peptidoglycan/LPS O-acetylase OafA/YrhL